MDSKKTRLVVLGLVGLLVFAAVIVFATKQNNNTNNQAGTPSAEREQDLATAPKIEESNKVTMKDLAFIPQKLVVKKGAQVQWINLDDAQHDVTSDQPPALDASGDDTRDFRGSGTLLSKGQSFSTAINKVGTYTYHCSKHPNMKGVVEVVE